MIHEKINECEKVVLFLLNVKFCFLKRVFCEWGSLNAFLSI
jgi:hypothetical protein